MIPLNAVTALITVSLGSFTGAFGQSADGGRWEREARNVTIIRDDCLETAGCIDTAAEYDIEHTARRKRS